MDTPLTTKLLQGFEDIKQIKDGYEFRSARDLQTVLWYAQWRNFEAVIQKAIISCKEAWNKESYHFADVSKPIETDLKKIERKLKSDEKKLWNP